MKIYLLVLAILISSITIMGCSSAGTKSSNDIHAQVEQDESPSIIEKNAAGDIKISTKELKEKTRKLIKEISRFVKKIPQYELPEKNEKGDIIIRRINPAYTNKE